MNLRLMKAIEFLAERKPDLLKSHKATKLYLMVVASKYAANHESFHDWDGCYKTISMLINEFCA